MYKKFLSLFLLLPLLLGADDRAFIKYKEGEKASNAVERKQAFNEALTLYLQMESDSPSALLCYNIANTYYQLNEFGYAILYYNKALKENPRLDEARANLDIALQKVGITQEKPNFIQNYVLFAHYKLSHNEKTIIVIIMFFIAFAFLSVYVWIPQLALKKAAFIAMWVALFFFTSIIWVDYFTAPQAVVVRPVALRRDAGDEYAPVVGPPVLSGTCVKVLDVASDGNWLKVESPAGEVGYISKEYARIV